MRVIAGSAKSIRLKYPKGKRIRPTTDAVRESLFGTLGADIRGACVADLYAGCGAVGIEALSRGAELAVFIERNVACVEALRANLANTQLEGQAEVVRGDVGSRWRATWRRWGLFDIVFADPPYGSRQLAGMVERLVETGEGVTPGGMVIIEHAASDELQTDGQPLRVCRYGETLLTFFAGPAEVGDGADE